VAKAGRSALISRKSYDKEKSEIKSKLANLVPQNFREVYEFFDFAMAAIVEKIYDREKVQAEIRMLNALRKGISYAEASEWARLTVEKLRFVREAEKKVAEFPEIRA
jgi:hypothetical protein